MEQMSMAINANLNFLVLFSLLIIAGAILLLVGAAITLVPQVNRTLTAYERLASTIETELEPTLSEANKLIGGFLKLQDLAQHSVSGVTTKVEDATVNLSKAAHDAKQYSHVWGAGLAAGLRAYLEGSQRDKIPKDQTQI